MGRLTQGMKAIISLGGTGIPWSTPRSLDIVYNSPWETDTTHAGIKVTSDKAMSYVPFFAAVRLISEDFASLPLGVYRKEGLDRLERPEHYLHPLLHDAPNPYMTSFSFREALQAHALTWGNGYAEIEYADDGSIIAFWPLRPDRMEILLNTETGRPFYRYQLGDSRKVDLPASKVFHYHGLGFDGITGYSVVRYAAGAIGQALAGEKFGSTYMERGSVPPAVLKYPGKLTAAGRTNLRASWDALDHRNRVAILEEGLDLQTIGVPPKDAQFIESAGMLRGMMATLFRIPPHMLGDVERSTSWGSGIEQQNIAYVVHTLRPWLTRFEQQAKLQLLKGDDHYLKFNVNAFMRGDAAQRWAAYEAGLRSGVYSSNDIREMEDKNPIEGGDVRFIPLNYQPLVKAEAEVEAIDAPVEDELTLPQQVEALGALIRAGFDPLDAARVLGLPPIEHTGLEPVTVSEQVKAATKAMQEQLTALQSRPEPTIELHIDKGAIQNDIAAPPVNVTTPPVTVTAPEVKVDVHVPEPKPRKVRRTVQRDDKDRITGMTEEPE